jgi:BirA family transcriptional regulator, biotin operon repressor / biotin---[acetyl-CoA-carboxylase] ligase
MSTRLIHHTSVLSTQETAFTHVCEGTAQDSRQDLWIIADEQEQGRGRHERVWHSPKGNLHASLLLIEPCEAQLIPQLSFVAGIALFDAVLNIPVHHGLINQNDLVLKWPNDLLLRGGKLGGILLESRIIHGKRAVVIGFGVNTAHAPEEMGYPCASLNLSPDQGRDALLQQLDGFMSFYLAKWNRGAGFSPLRHEWMKRAMPHDTPFYFRHRERIVEGFFAGITGQGHLMLRNDQGVKIYDSGDVILSTSHIP